MKPVHICHTFSTFVCGGPQVRTADIINALGPRFRHTIVAVDNRFDARSLINESALVNYVAPPAGKGGLAYPLAFRKLLLRVRPDLLVTYNWGAMDAVVGGQLAGRCPIVHTEDGFGPDEAKGLKSRRVWTRRFALRVEVRRQVHSASLHVLVHGSPTAVPCRGNQKAFCRVLFILSERKDLE